MTDFLPTTEADLRKQSIKQLDFIFVTGDAYVDHPTFGVSLLARYLNLYGYSVGIIAQPKWHTVDDFKKLGKPKLGFLVSAGSVDSMVNHYNVFKRKRPSDAYSPGGKSGYRPDRATIVYSKRLKEAFPHIPVIIGGVEASLRRLGHYDYWDDSVRKSILLDSKADLLIYGMAEKTLIELADALKSGLEITDITWLDGTVYKGSQENLENLYEYEVLPDYNTLKNNKKAYGDSFVKKYESSTHGYRKNLVEKYDENTYIIQNPMAMPLSKLEMDRIYEMEFTRDYHPSYEKFGGVPASEEVRFSILANRGCYGGCSFCAITFHQGALVQSRSKASILNEGQHLTTHPKFKGYIHDVGGPTANFTKAACKKQLEKGACTHKYCLYPKPCKQLEVDHTDYVSILKGLRAIEGVKKVFIRSGIRYDYVLADSDPTFLKTLVKHHVSGLLKVAPEHNSSPVLKQMKKPGIEQFEVFKAKFEKISEEIGKEQYVLPYFISSHPGSTMKDAIALAIYMKKHGIRANQVQDFYPTPGTLSTCMYYTGMDPFTKEQVYIPKSLSEKRMQRALLHYNKKENYELVKTALLKENRQDLIGFDNNALIRPKNRSRRKEIK